MVRFSEGAVIGKRVEQSRNVLDARFAEKTVISGERLCLCGQNHCVLVAHKKAVIGEDEVCLMGPNPQRVCASLW